MQLPAPNTVLKKIGGAIRPNHRFAFITAFITGLVVHSFLFFNYLLNSDTTWRLVDTIDMTNLGRWFSRWADYPSSYVNTPWVIGLLAVLYLAVTSALLTEMFSLQNKASIFLVSAVLVAFPSVTSTFSYLVGADGFMMALMLATIAVFLTQKWKWGFLPGVVFFAFSIGIYQTYVGYALLLVLIVLLFYVVLDKEATLRGLWQKVWRYLVMGGGGLALYWVILKVVLAVTHTTMSEYQNVDILTSSPATMVTSVLGNIIRPYTSFFETYFSWPGFNTTSRLFLLALFLVLLGLFLVYFIVKTKVYRSLWRMLSIAAIALLLPLGASFVSILNSGSQLHMLMRQPFCVLFMLLALGLDKLPEKPKKPLLPNLMKWAALLLTFVLCFQFYLTANIAYTNMYIRQEKMYSTTLRMLDRVEQLDGYEPGMPLVIVGMLHNSEYYPYASVLDPMIEGMNDTQTNVMVERPSVLLYYFRDFHNIPFAPPSEEQMQMVETSPEILEMDAFPAASSVRIIDGVAVIKVAPDNTVSRS